MSVLATHVNIKTLPAGKKHAIIFKNFDGLEKDEQFIVIADHDPKPLYFQFLFERSGQFDWQRIQNGPDEWHIRIRRIREAPNGQKSAEEIGSCKCGKKETGT